LRKGENVILFLSKEKMYDGYSIVASYQGKININSKGVVYGFEIKNMSLPAMEKNIVELLSKPVNDTSNRNATEEAMYVNDSDKIFNESDLNPSAN
jgi:hypothetical protein